MGVGKKVLLKEETKQRVQADIDEINLTQRFSATAVRSACYILAPSLFCSV